MTLSICNRAELVRALAQHDPVTTSAMADMLGYRETPHAKREPTAPPPELSPHTELEMAEVADTPYRPTNVPFWRLEQYESLSDHTSPDRQRPRRTYVAWRSCPSALPAFSPLAPKRVVLTRLRQVATTRNSTREVDAEAVVERLSHGRLLDDLPKRQRRAWGSELLIVKDRAWRLTPYWQDQDVVVNALLRLYPPHGVTVARLQDGARQLIPLSKYRKALPMHDVPVLVLSDLGCLANEGDLLHRFWLNWGRRLRTQRTPAIALVPTHVKTISPELARVWTLVRWDTSSATGSDVMTQSESSVVEQLITLLSPTVRLEPGLLRAVRGVLPEGRRDAGLEARVWQHAAIASPHSVAASWKATPRQTYLARFSGQSEADRQAVLDLIRTWRAQIDPAVWFEEVLGLDAQSCHPLIDPEDIEDAMAFITVFSREAWESGDTSAELRAWTMDLLERLPPVAYHDDEMREAAHYLFALAYPGVVAGDAPWWYDPERLPSLPDQIAHEVAIWQVANQLHLQVAQPASASDAAQIACGSPLGTIRTARGELKVAGVDWLPSVWAYRWGHDAYGPWATFRIGDVEQSLRWITPGQFWMGSPEDEEGRYDHEGPRHEVELSQGFWLFDTPCTQALWEAVMDENPSDFKGANRPVESVSWEDCQVFISKLNEQVPGLGLRLPTEAQWEYACRAGTQEARYDQDIDAIAWYSENSNFETHDVAQKRPNAWGLYDMLGNVYEWVQDWHDEYTAASLTDPEGPAAGSLRVIRGGYWDDPARHVRAAYRHACAPGARFPVIGFRCLSSGSEPRRARETWGESQQKAEPAETPRRQPAARLLNVQRQSELETVFPDANWIEVSTDRERLRFGQITKPSWAKAIGRDGYGLWVRLEVKGVRQRLRWIAPGRFWMGSPEDEEERFGYEVPRYEVELTRGFWLFDTPCTQAFWEAVMEENSSQFPGANRPVESVSWEDSQAFINRLNEELPDLGLRLPTEAQWEYACRAGTQGARYDLDLDAIAWYDENSGGETHDVAQKRPNAWGLYDMLGNVDEWCHDGRRDYESGLAVDPVGPTAAGSNRVLRGGYWDDPAQGVRAAIRDALVPGLRYSSIGFRCLSSGVSPVDGMRRARRRAESGAREDRDRSDDGGRPHKGKE